MAFFKVLTVLLVSVYAGIMLVLTLPLQILMRWRIRQGKETPQRVQARQGKSTCSMPSGQQVIWIHGASIGEVRSALPLVKALLKQDPRHCILLTSQTLTSETILKPYLSDRVFYQAAPLDHPIYLRRFFRHWKPHALCVFEAECWPFWFFYAGYIQKIPLLSINFHLSEKSFVRWRKVAWLFRGLYAPFRWISSSCPTSLAHYQELTGKVPTKTVSLKYASAVLRKSAERMSSRPVWMASCFHESEQAELCHLILRMHQAIPDLLTVLAPRHLDRLAHWEARLSALHVRRDDCSADVCLVSELGVLDQYYAQTSVVLLGGSFAALGGHNLIEPAQFGCAIICGPHMSSCLDVLQDFQKKHAVCQVQNFAQAYDQVIHFLTHPQRMGLRAREVLEQQKTKAQESLSKMTDLIVQIKN